jgi:asparagine synthase (glutamine-hydrolysing)
MGFGVPLGKWFRGPLRRRLRESLLGGELAATGIFNQDYLQRLVDDHQSGLREYSAPLWSLLMFQASIRDDQFTLGQ